MTVIHERAFAKVNLCLLMGRPRADGRHELVTLFESVGLADDVRLIVASGEAGAAEADEVVCPGVRGPNLVSAALAALRERGWAGPPLRVEIDKRIPVAAGMGGGSSDAAAVLRGAAALGPEMQAGVLAEIAAGLGSDVPSQLDPGVSLGLGAGDHVTPLPDLAAHALVVVPQTFSLSTADVYREADRLGLGRDAASLGQLRADLEAGLSADGRPGLVVNDLQAAALCLRSEIEDALDAVREAGIEESLVCGSGPTVIGAAWGPDALARAQTAAERLHERFPGTVAVQPVLRGDGASAANR
jgi:4-diphosphocytidyl-2-C-methyl-D-erythritol kinase